jgi:DNA-binding NtrC family response regulator
LQKFARSMQRPAKRLSPDATRALREHSWPGNVRELEHAIEHAMVLSQKDVITATDLPFARQPTSLREPESPTASGASGRATPAAAEGAGSATSAMGPAGTTGPLPGTAMLADLADEPYAEAKRRLVALFDETYTGELLRRTGGNMSEAARRAGLDRSNFRRLLKRHRD